LPYPLDHSRLFGTLAQIRTERTSPFERDDFTNLSTRALFGADGRNRTVKPKRGILSPLCLPISPHPHVSYYIQKQLNLSIMRYILTWCPRRDSNSQNPVSKTDMYTYSITRAFTKSKSNSLCCP